MVQNTNPKHALSEEKHKLFCSGVGMLLWLVKHSRPDIANCVRKLSKVLDGATEASYKEMSRTIKYVLDSCNLSLKIEPTHVLDEHWTLVCFSDSNYAGNLDSC